MIILGISAFYHDSAAALIKDGVIIAATWEERFTRIKHDSAFPQEAIRFCLSKAGATLDEIDSIVFFEKPFLKFERLFGNISFLCQKGFFNLSRHPCHRYGFMKNYSRKKLS